LKKKCLENLQDVSEKGATPPRNIRAKAVSIFAKIAEPPTLSGRTAFLKKTASRTIPLEYIRFLALGTKKFNFSLPFYKYCRF